MLLVGMSLFSLLLKFSAQFVHPHSVNSSSEFEAKNKHLETRKSNEYRNVSLSDDPRFVPFIVDNTGNIGPKALSFLSRLGDYSKDISGRSVGSKASKKFARLFIQCMQYKLLESLYLQREIHQNSIESSILSYPIRNIAETYNFKSSVSSRIMQVQPYSQLISNYLFIDLISYSLFTSCI